VSLIKKPLITDEKLAANQANGRQSRGPATEEGIERIRAANTRHGYYSQAPGAQMHVLGEDPEEFERLFESLLEVWKPENPYQKSLVRRMARLTWRLERADRIQEAMLVSQMENLDRNVAHELRQQAARHERVMARLRSLMQALDANRFCSTTRDLDGLGEIYGKVPSGVGLEIMSRVYRLLSPRETNAGSPETATKDKEGELAIATGAERDVLRAELRQLLREDIKRLEEEHQQRQAELAEITPAFRDSMLVPKHPQTALLVRLGDSDLRQLRFVTGLLMRLKAQGSRKPAEEAGSPAKSSEYPTI
jgi:hypothetical protein